MNSIFFVVSICGFLVLVQSAPNVKLPKGFLKCKPSDADFDKCVTVGSNLAVPELVKGQPKFGIPTIDPLRISTLYIDQGHGSVNIRLNFTDLDIRGLSSAVVSETKVNINKGEIDVKLYTKSPLVLNGQYSVDGKVLVLPISGKGPCNLTLADFKVVTATFYKPTEKHGETYWTLQNMKFDFTTSKLQLYLSNLFNGDKNLGSQMNLFLNENWKEILEELRPAINEALSSIFSQMAQRFFERVPISQVFPK